MNDHHLRAVRRALFSLGLLVLTSACGSATYVRKESQGGELALRGSYGFAMGNARELVIAHCGGRYEQSERDGVLQYDCLDPEPLAKAAARPRSE